MIAVRCWVLAMAGLLLASCGSMTLPSMHSASFNESNFGFVDARALGVKVSLPRGYTLDARKTTLMAHVDATAGVHNTELALELVNTTEGKHSSGMVSSKEVDVTTFELDLPEESVKSLRELQRAVAQKTVKSVSLEVRVSLAEAPEGATSVKVWIELLMSGMEGYFTIIDGATIPIERTTTPGGS